LKFFVIPECLYRESTSANNPSNAFVISNNDSERARNHLNSVIPAQAGIHFRKQSIKSYCHFERTREIFFHPPSEKGLSRRSIA